MSDCKIIHPNLPDDLVEKLIVKFAEEKLCKCSLEEFNYQVSRNRLRDGSEAGNGTLTQEGLKEALFRGVLNEMVLRIISGDQSCQKQ